jgi:hypothetical protein
VSGVALVVTVFDNWCEGDRRSCPGHGLTERKTNRSRHGHCSARGLCLGTEDSLSMLVVDVFIPSAFAGLCEPMAECGDA